MSRRGYSSIKRFVLFTFVLEVTLLVTRLSLSLSLTSESTSDVKKGSDDDRFKVIN